MRKRRHQVSGLVPKVDHVGMSIRRPTTSDALHHSQCKPLAQRPNQIPSTISLLPSLETQWVAVPTILANLPLSSAMAVARQLSGEQLPILGRLAEWIDENATHDLHEPSQPISVRSRYPNQSCTMTSDCRSSIHVFEKPT